MQQSQQLEQLEQLDIVSPSDWLELEREKLKLEQRKLELEIRRVQVLERQEARWQRRYPSDRSDITGEPGQDIEQLPTIQELDTNLNILVDLISACEEAGTPCPAASAGTRTAYSVLSCRPGFPDQFKRRGGRKLFSQALETLRATKRVCVDVIRRNGTYVDRHPREVLLMPKRL